MILYLHSENPEIRKLKKISEDLKNGDVYVFPTDTVYAFIADSASKTGIEKIDSIKRLDKHQPLSLLCPDISTASNYLEYFPDECYRIMKRCTPGPYVFILKSSKLLLKASVAHMKNREIGIRIVDHIFIKTLLGVHEGTLTATSVTNEGEFILDPNEIDDVFGHRVKGIVDGGILESELATVIDFTGEEVVVKRAGKGYENLMKVL